MKSCPRCVVGQNNETSQDVGETRISEIRHLIGPRRYTEDETVKKLGMQAYMDAEAVQITVSLNSTVCVCRHCMLTLGHRQSPQESLIFLMNSLMWKESVDESYALRHKGGPASETQCQQGPWE